MLGVGTTHPDNVIEIAYFYFFLTFVYILHILYTEYIRCIYFRRRHDAATNTRGEFIHI